MHHLFKIIWLLLPLSLFANDAVLVSVAPHKYFVERIAGDTVKVQLLVPPGVSSHTYEPTPKQMLACVSAVLWFQIGESFETKVTPVLKNANPNMEIVDLREGLELIESGCCREHAGADPHIWVSPKMAKQQAKTIEAALVKKFPGNRALYEKNLALFLTDLDQLDADVTRMTEPMKRSTILVSHPAYGYLARDYGFQQMAIEQEGKDPSPQQLTALMNQAREKQIKAIFIQEQLSAKGARLTGQVLGVPVIVQDPYREDYLNNMRSIVQDFSEKG